MKLNVKSRRHLKLKQFARAFKQDGADINKMAALER